MAGSGLNFKTKVDIAESKARLLELKKLITDVGGINMSGSNNAGFNTKPLTEYQAGILKIKQQALDLAAANKSASLVTQEALQKERLALVEINKQRALNALQAQQAKSTPNTTGKRITEFSDSSAEVAAYLKSREGSVLYTTAIRNETVERARVNAEAARQAVLNNEISLSNSAYVNSAKQATEATKAITLSKKELALQAERDKQLAAENTAAIKLQAKEMNAAKGSLDQRRAALTRLQRAFDGLNESERKSAAGQRLQGIVGSLSTQVKELEASTGRAQRNVGNYGSAFSKAASGAWAALKQVANILPGVGIAGLLAFAIDPIVDYISSLDLFKKKLNSAQKEQAGLNSALASSDYSKAVRNVNELSINIDLAKKGFLSKTAVVNEYNETIGKTTGLVNTLDQAEQQLTKNGDAYIKMTLYKAAANLALDEAAKKAYQAEQERNKTDEEARGDLNSYLMSGVKNANNPKVAAIYKQGAETRRKQAAAELEKDGKSSLEIAKNFQKKAAEIAKGYKFDLFGGTENGKKAPVVDAALSARNNLQREIDDVNRAAKRNQLTSDQEEIKAIEDKYKKIGDKIADFNKKFKGKYKVDSSGLVQSQKLETEEKTAKQDIDKQKQTIEIQKQIYTEYEQTKTQVGEEEANKRFGAELKGAKSLVEYLDNLKPADSDKSAYANKMRDLLKDLQPKAVADQAKVTAQQYASAYEAAKTHAQALLAIERDYQAQVIALGESATEEQRANLKRQRDDRVRSENEANFEIKTGWEHLFENFDQMSRKAILKRLNDEKAKVIEAASLPLDKGGISEEDAANKINKIDQAIDSLDSNAGFGRVADKFKAWHVAIGKFGKNSEQAKGAFRALLNEVSLVTGTITSDLEKLAGALGDAGVGGEGLQSTFKNIMGVVTGAGELARGIATGNPVDIVTGSIKLLSSAISLFDKKDAKLQAKIDGYQRQLTALGQSYKDLDRAVKNAVGNDIYADQAAQIDNLRAQQQKLIQMRDAEEDKKKTDQGKIDDYNAQIADIPNQIEDIQQAISANLIQGTFRELSNSLADALTSAFQAGEDGIAAMDKSLDQFIANAIKNSLKLAFFDKDVKRFTDDLTEYAKAHENSVVGFDFDSWKKIFNKDADNFNAGLEASKDIFKSGTATDTKSSSLIGDFKALTEDTGGLLVGQFNGQRVATLQLVQYSGQNLSLLQSYGKTLGDIYINAISRFEELKKIEANTLRTANNTDRLESIEKALASIDKKTGAAGNALAANGRPI
jgi:hypothetical protein